MLFLYARGENDKNYLKISDSATGRLIDCMPSHHHLNNSQPAHLAPRPVESGGGRLGKVAAGNQLRVAKPVLVVDGAKHALQRAVESSDIENRQAVFDEGD